MPIAIPSTSNATAVQGTQRSALTQSDASSSSSSFSDALSEASQQTVAPRSAASPAATHGNASELAIAHLRSVPSGERKASPPKAIAVPAKSAPALIQTPDAPAGSTATRIPIQGDPLAATLQSLSAAQPAEPPSESGSVKQSDDLKSGSHHSSLADPVTATGAQLAGTAVATPLAAARAASLATTGMLTSEVPTSVKPSAGMLPLSPAQPAGAASVARLEAASLPPEAEGQSRKGVAVPQSAAISPAAATATLFTYTASGTVQLRSPALSRSQPGSNPAAVPFSIGSPQAAPASIDSELAAGRLAEAAKAPEDQRSAGRATDSSQVFSDETGAGAPTAAAQPAPIEMQQPAHAAASNSIEQAVLAAATPSATLVPSTPTFASPSGVSSTAISAGKDAIRNGTPGRSASPASKVSAPSPAATLSGQPTGLAAASPRTTAAGSIPTQEKANEQEGRGGHDSHKAAPGVDAATKPATSGSQATASAADATAAVSPLLVMQNGAAQDANAATAANGLSQAVQQLDTLGQGTAGDKQGSQPGELPAAAAASADALPAINTARVLQSMQGTEMRVGMHTAEFGNISVNTSINTALNRQSIAAQISFEHLDLGRALTAHLPQIEAKLSSDYGMHARVEVKDQSAGPTSEGNREGARQQGGTGGGSAGRATSQMVSASGTGAGAGESLDTANGSGARADALYHGMRLDIRA